MGFVKFASDYEADQKAMQAEADGLEDIVLANPSFGPSIAEPWSAFYKELTEFTQTPVYDVWTPFLPNPHFLATSGLADTFASEAAQLEGWRQTINKAAGSSVPGFTDPTGQQAAAQTVSALTSIVKWGAVGAGVLLTFGLLWKKLV